MYAFVIYTYIHVHMSYVLYIVCQTCCISSHGPDVHDKSLSCTIVVMYDLSCTSGVVMYVWSCTIVHETLSCFVYISETHHRLRESACLSVCESVCL